MSSVHLLVVVGFAALLLWAAASDLRAHLIPNPVSLAIAALWPAHVLASPAAVDWAGGLLVALAAFALGFAAFAMRLAGGGDVKLFAAVALWAGPALVLPLVLVTALVGGLVALATLVRLRLAQPRTAAGPGFGLWLGVALKAEIAYGLGIAAGGLFVAIRLLGIGG